MLKRFSMLFIVAFEFVIERVFEFITTMGAMRRMTIDDDCADDNAGQIDVDALKLSFICF